VVAHCVEPPLGSTSVGLPSGLLQRASEGPPPWPNRLSQAPCSCGSHPSEPARPALFKLEPHLEGAYHREVMGGDLVQLRRYASRRPFGGVLGSPPRLGMVGLELRGSSSAFGAPRSLSSAGRLTVQGNGKRCVRPSNAPRPVPVRGTVLSAAPFEGERRPPAVTVGDVLRWFDMVDMVPHLARLVR
jgi:hypothetical protein